MNHNNGRIVDREWNKNHQDKYISDYIKIKNTFKISVDENRKHKESLLIAKFDYSENLP